MFKIHADSLDSRHEVVRDQLEVIDGWVEDLPIANAADRRGVMLRIVDFLQRYVVVDVAWEEEHCFPAIGEHAATLRAEHAYILRWVKELESLANGPSPLDAVRFRRTAYKLIGLLEAHMHAEEAVVTSRRPEDWDTVPAEIT